jgi:hypothetical protein
MMLFVFVWPLCVGSFQKPTSQVGIIVCVPYGPTTHIEAGRLDILIDKANIIVGFVEAIRTEGTTFQKIQPWLEALAEKALVSHIPTEYETKLLGLTLVDLSDMFKLDKENAAVVDVFISVMNPFDAEDPVADAHTDLSASNVGSRPRLAFNPLKPQLRAMSISLPMKLQILRKVLVHDVIKTLTKRGIDTCEVMLLLAQKFSLVVRTALRSCEDAPADVEIILAVLKGLEALLNVSQLKPSFDDVVKFASDRTSGLQTAHADVGIALSLDPHYKALLDDFVKNVPTFRELYPKMMAAIKGIEKLLPTDAAYLDRLSDALDALETIRPTFGKRSMKLETTCKLALDSFMELARKEPAATAQAEANAHVGNLSFEHMDWVLKSAHAAWPMAADIQQYVEWWGQASLQKSNLQRVGKVAKIINSIEADAILATDVESKALAKALKDCLGHAGCKPSGEDCVLVVGFAKKLIDSFQVVFPGTSEQIELLVDLCAYCDGDKSEPLVKFVACCLKPAAALSSAHTAFVAAQAAQAEQKKRFQLRGDECLQPCVGVLHRRRVWLWL